LASVAIMPVSARLAERAASAASPELAALLHAEAGVNDLRRALRTTVGCQVERLRSANMLRAARTQLAAVGRALDTEREVRAAGSRGTDRWRVDRERLVGARRAGGRIWQVRLRADLQRARLDTTMELRREIRDQVQRWRHQIDLADRDSLERLPASLDLAVRVLSRDQMERVLRRLHGVTIAVLGELFGPPAVADVYAAFARAPVPLPALAAPDRRQPNAEDRVVALGGVMAGFGAGRLVALVPAIGGAALASAITLPVSVGLGLAASAWMIRSRQHAADRQHYRQWLVETLGEVRACVETEIAAQFLDAEQVLTLALSEAIDRRVEALDHEIARLDVARQQDSATRERERRSLEARLAAVAHAISEVDAVLPELLRGAAPPAPPAPSGSAPERSWPS
jgi:hypothetical protein